MALANYVKFRRGTPASYAALEVKDADSLYFISEKGATQGVLYLGDKLISGSLTSNISLSEDNPKALIKVVKGTFLVLSILT